MPAAHRPALGVGHALGTAQRLSVGFHHHVLNPPTGFDAQPVKRLLHVLQNALQRHRNLNFRLRQVPRSPT